HLKPANIFLQGNGEITTSNLHQAAVRIADFSLVQAVRQARTGSQADLGCPMPQYLAPEQLQHRGRPVEPACDLYALGVIWYDLLTGRCPVRGTTREEILAR